MPEAGTRIPAWRRLGLALKNETHSGVAAPEPSTSVADQQHVTPYDGQNGSHSPHHTAVEVAVNGKSAKLGKRKHQHEPAEDEHTLKRGKPSPVHVDSKEVDGATSADAPHVEVAEVATSSVQPASADASQPKGDPNYRRKKAKPKNKRRVPEDAQPAPKPAQTAASHDRSSLSPGAQAPAPKKGRQALLASTETDHEALAPTSTPRQHREASRGSTKDPSGSPSGIDRRKSVTFTPDTKRVDGHSAQNLFKKWAADQKGVNANSSLAELEERAQFLDEQTARNAEEVETKQKEEKNKAAKVSQNSASAKPPKQESPATTTTPAKSKGKKKDPSTYVSYLTQYHTDRNNWKFNKAKQNDVIDNATNIFRIPEEHSDALLEYVQGLKGAGAIELLTLKCQAALKELDEEDAKNPAMDDPEERKAMQDEAMQARIAKEQKRRKVEGDMEALSSHPHGDNFIRRLRRKRAEALLAALGRTSPILPAPSTQTSSFNPLMQNLAPKRDSKKRKRRGDVSSSDESSSDSSSDAESSSDESDDEDGDAASNSGSSSSEAGGASDSGSGSGSGSDSASGEADSSDDNNDSDSD